MKSSENVKKCVLDFQKPKFIHTMNKLVNGAYFNLEQKKTDYGYTFYSRYSKIKNKHVIEKSYDFSQLEGEIITFHKNEGFSKSIEILYNIDKVFNRENYENKKKYQNRVKSPLTLSKKMNMKIRIADIEDLDNISKLHDEWVEKKISDPRVHKITFSSKRYINCVKLALILPNHYQCYVFEVDGKINGCRVLAIQNDIAFDLAFFSRFWEVSQLTEAQNILSLHHLLSIGIDYLNTGLASGTLKKYKKQYPHNEVYVYRKNQYNQTTLESILND